MNLKDIFGFVQKYRPVIVKGVKSLFGSKKKKKESNDVVDLIGDLLVGGQESQTKSNPDGGFGIDDIIKTFVPDEKKVTRTSKTTKSKSKKKR